MGTRSIIGLKNLDGTYETVYCHWDGYPSHNGLILAKNYTTEALVRDLISFGDMSSLKASARPKGASHTYDSPEPDVTIYYHRDLGESWENTKPKILATNEDPHQEEYCYIWDCFAGHWLFKGHREKEFKRLTEESAAQWGDDE